ncbi:MAG: ATP-dependent DNA helicase, partial [Thiohalorhabdaceae bacterium]
QSGRKVLVSTGTKNLQDQLYHRDLPLLRRALGTDFRTALLKGRGNYLCLHRMERSHQRQHLLAPETRQQLAYVREWARTTTSGDRAELSALPEDAAVWPRVSVGADNCLHTDCDFYEDCHLIQARRRAQEADVVVVNHHLFCADLALKNEGVADLLPRADAVIFDEAHQLPDAAGRFFGVSVSSYNGRELARDTREEYTQEAGDDPQVGEAADLLERRADEWRAEGDWRGTWAQALGAEAVVTATDNLRAGVDHLRNVLEHHRERGKGLNRCYERAGDLADRLDFLRKAEDSDYVFWAETRGKGAFVHATPLEVAGPFQEATGGPGRQGWVFTSATLAVGESFTHFRAKLGLGEDTVTRQWPSSFHFQEQARLYLPPGLPQPGTEAHTERLLDAALPVVEAAGGGAFFLFTSHRALNQAAERLRRETAFPLLVQGEMPRDTLIQHFRSLGDAVLLGTGSFWEGVDVPGSNLRHVVITKLPFPNPADPLTEATAEHLEQQGMNPFYEFFLPEAILRLKQGFGRLIRNRDDVGEVSILDSRIVNKNYGQQFLNALPDCKIIYDLN